MRRQFVPQKLPFLLEECGFPAAVNDPSYRFPFVVSHPAERG
jgi:hypothetical protein